MRSLRLLCLFLALGLPATALAGDIQVTCEPGLKVYLDGNFAGITNTNQDGLFLAGVAEGKHTVRVDKPGCMPQGYAVVVTKLPIQVKVRKFVPIVGGIHVDREESKADESEMVGRLLITSAPQNCDVAIDGKSQRKDTPVLTLARLPRGKHTISFSRPGEQPVSAEINLEPGAELMVRGDLINGRVDVSYEGIGSLRFYSQPEGCKIFILGSLRQKNTAVMNITYVPAGRHHLVATWGGREVSGDVLVNNGYRTVVTINFAPNATPLTFSYEPE